MDRLPSRYQHFFAVPKSLPNKKREYYKWYYIAFDAEWYEVAGRNIVLSYQIATCSKDAVNNIIEYMEPDQRLTLAEVVELGIRSVNGGAIPECHAHPDASTKIHLIAHHVTAEWSVLADRKAPHITNCLSAVRKSPITTRFGIPVSIGDGVMVKVFIDDTRLIAPVTHQKLADLSKLLGSDEDLKIDVEHYYKKRMNLLLRDDPDRYQKYALQDSIITLKLWFMLQDSLAKLAGEQRLYSTLASAAVTGYMRKLPNYRTYQAVLNSRHYADAYKLIKRAYLGGRNEGYFVGRSEKYRDLLGERIWVDIDFVGCYPTAMALCPTIDCQASPFDVSMSGEEITHLIDSLNVETETVWPTYFLEDRSDEALRAMGVPVAPYREVQAILDRVPKCADIQAREAIFAEFDEYLRTLPRRREECRASHVRKIRELSQGVDNTQLDRWYRQWTDARDRGDTSFNRFIIPGFARVRFTFPPDSEFPCLPVPHRQYGLIYPLEGETVATAPELMLALDAGAEIKVITSLELKILRDDTGMPKRHFFEHLAELTKQRAIHKKTMKDETLPKEERLQAQVMERLTKECLNSFYGKSAQAINFRKTYQAATGEMRPLTRSRLSEACAAALTTGLARAALGATLLAVQGYNRGKNAKSQIVVVSATTDGLLLGLPRPKDFCTADYYTMGGKGLEIPGAQSKVEPLLEKCGCSDLWKRISAYLPIRQMRNSRKELTWDEVTGGNDTFLEIKNLADRIAGIKTRGQIGWIDFHGEEKVTILAKFGHKPPLSDIVAEKNPGLTQWEQEEVYKGFYDGNTTDRNTLEVEWLMEKIGRIENGEEEIFDYVFYGLTGFSEMMKREEHLDLVQKIGVRRFNADFDWKRKLELRDGSIDPRTRPYRNMTEMLSYRAQMQAERRWGRNARPLKVLHKQALKGAGVRHRGGEAATVVRLFLRGIRNRHIPCSPYRLPKGGVIAEKVNQVWLALGCTFEVMESKKKGEKKPVDRLKKEWTADDVKKAGCSKRWERGVVIPTARLERLLLELARAFGADPVQAREEIFASGLQEEASKALAFYVVQAIVQAPGLGMRPYSDLYLKGLLPGKAEVVRLFHPLLSDADITEAGRRPFLAGQCWASDQPHIVRLFRRLGLTVRDSEACARILAPPRERKAKVPHNPAVNRCMECFVHAILHPDLVRQGIPPIRVLDRLRWYGLKRHRYYSLRRSKFAPHCLTDTPENRRQIVMMAESLQLDPVPIMDALIDK